MLNLCVLQLVPENSADVLYILYPSRFVILASVALGNFINTAIATSFSPITPTAAIYYGVGEFNINVLYIIYLAMYCLISPLSCWYIDRRGLRFAIIFGAFLNMIGVSILFAANFIPSQNGCFAFAMLGQIVLSSAQPFYFNVPPKVSALWFPPNQRTMASSFMALTQPFGSAMVFALGPAIISTSKQSFILFHGILLALAILFSIPSFFTQDAPPSPPSPSADFQHELFSDGLQKIWKDKSYILLLISGGLNVGILNCFTALITDLLVPYGYSQSDAGNVGIMNVGVGLIFAGFFCYTADKTQQHGPILTICCIFTTIGSFLIYASLTPNMTALMYIANAVMGMGLFATIPISMELAVDVTFPVCEGTSNGFLQMTGNFMAILLIIFSNLFRGSEFRNSALLLGCVSFCAVIAAFFFKNDKKREDHVAV